MLKSKWLLYFVLWEVWILSRVYCRIFWFYLLFDYNYVDIKENVLSSLNFKLLKGKYEKDEVEKSYGLKDYYIYFKISCFIVLCYYVNC